MTNVVLSLPLLDCDWCGGKPFPVSRLVSAAGPGSTDFRRNTLSLYQWWQIVSSAKSGPLSPVECRTVTTKFYWSAVRKDVFSVARTYSLYWSSCCLQKTANSVLRRPQEYDVCSLPRQRYPFPLSERQILQKIARVTGAYGMITCFLYCTIQKIVGTYCKFLLASQMKGIFKTNLLHLPQWRH